MVSAFLKTVRESLGLTLFFAGTAIKYVGLALSDVAEEIDAPADERALLEADEQAFEPSSGGLGSVELSDAAKEMLAEGRRQREHPPEASMKTAPLAGSAAARLRSARAG